MSLHAALSPTAQRNIAERTQTSTPLTLERELKMAQIVALNMARNGRKEHQPKIQKRGDVMLAEINEQIVLLEASEFFAEIDAARFQKAVDKFAAETEAQKVLFSNYLEELADEQDEVAPWDETPDMIREDPDELQRLREALQHPERVEGWDDLGESPFETRRQVGV